MEAESTQATETYIKVMEWLHTNRKPLTVGGGIVVVAILAITIMSWEKNQTEAKANADLLNVPLPGMIGNQVVTANPNSFLDVSKQYPDTPSGEYARLLGANSLFREEKFPEAHEQFSQFIDKYPQSALIPQAKVGLAASLEGEGKISEAAQLYQQIISTYSSDANIVTPVKLTLARLDEQLNKPDLALNYYIDLSRIQNPYDPWAAEARERGELLLMKHPELRKNVTSSAPAAQSPTAGLNIYSSHSNAAPVVSPSNPQP
jgi:TolA-binding protein